MITREQQLFINHALPVFRKDPRISGVALGGSYIKKEQMDEYSGVDFVISVCDENWDEVLADRVNIAARLGTLLASFTGEHIQRPNQLICLYDEPLLHVDLGFTRQSEIGERYDDPVIMYQEGSVMSTEYSKHPVKAQTPDLQWFEDRFWIWVHFIATRIGRRDLFDAIDSLSHLRLNVLGPLISMKNGFSSHGVRHIERDCPQEAELLKATIAQYDAKSCVRALKAAADLYISLRGVSKTGLILRDKAESRSLRYLNIVAERID